MYNETMTALRIKIESIDFAPYSAILSIYPSPLVQPDDPALWETPSIAITEDGDAIEDPARQRRGQYMALTDANGNPVLDAHGKYISVVTPIPHIISYQIDFRTDAQMNDHTGILCLNVLRERFLAAMRQAGTIPATWTFTNGYQLVRQLLYRSRQSAQNLDGQAGDGMFWRRWIYQIETWLFPSATVTPVEAIDYRLIEFMRPPEWQAVMVTANPENYGG